MKCVLTVISLLVAASTGFVPFVARPARVSLSRRFLSQSRLEGNQREPTAQELVVMDEMITKLADAKPYELPNAVRRAFRVCSSPRFFVRIAERTDIAVSEEEKEKLGALAANLVACLDALVSTTEDQLDERAKEVENVVKAAAEPESGEFLVPLSAERVQAMKTTLQDLEPSSLDEAFLTTLDSWANKSFQDGMDGMVTIIQKVLQLYAGIQLKRARAAEADTPVGGLFDRLLDVDSDLWDAEARNGIKESDVTQAALVSEIQRAMEERVLGLESGSINQRVQAEYLKELLGRVEALPE